MQRGLLGMASVPKDGVFPSRDHAYSLPAEAHEKSINFVKEVGVRVSAVVFSE